MRKYTPTLPLSPGPGRDWKGVGAATGSGKSRLVGVIGRPGRLEQLDQDAVGVAAVDAEAAAVGAGGDRHERADERHPLGLQPLVQRRQVVHYQRQVAAAR